MWEKTGVGPACVSFPKGLVNQVPPRHGHFWEIYRPTSRRRRRRGRPQTKGLARVRGKMKLRLITSLIAAAACIGWSGGAIPAAPRQGVGQDSVQPIGPSYSLANRSSPRPHVFLII